MILVGIFIGLMFIAAIILHEVGHLFVITVIYKRAAKVRLSKTIIGISYDDDGIQDHQRLMVYSGGILAGLIPILILIDAGVLTVFGQLIVLAFYILGCNGDLRKIGKIFLRKSFA